MQIVGVSVTDEAIASIARRSTRPVVVEWAERVLKRHVRRTKGLLVRIKDGKKLDAALKADGLSSEICQRIRNAFEAGEEIFAPSKMKMGAFLVRAADTMDWIESLSADDRRIRRIERMAWEHAENHSEAWHASLAKARRASKSIMEGARKLVDLEGGAFAAELTTQGALQAEGKAMGHCVGGYWMRVQKGETRIVSIRDTEGNPHVTIELAGAPVLKFGDGGELKATHRPSNGVAVVHEATTSWIAVQIRGKENKQPVPRHMGSVMEWLEVAGIPWVEYGYDRTSLFGGPAGEPTSVYTVHGRHFRDPDAACAFGEPKFLQEFSKKGEAFGKPYYDSGLAAVHREMTASGSGRELSFFEEAAPVLMDGFSKLVGKGKAFQTALNMSGVHSALDAFARHGKADVKLAKRVFDTAVALDPADAVFTEEAVVTIPGGKDVRLVVHSLPLMPLFMLSAGFAKGIEHEVIALVAPHLKASVSRMQADPSAIHAVKAAIGAVLPDDIRKAYLFCGLAADYAVASEKVLNGVIVSVKDARLALRRARSAGRYDIGSINKANNLLAEGYEARLAEWVQRRTGAVLILSPAPKKEVVFRRPATSEPVLKNYTVPGMRI